MTVEAQRPTGRPDTSPRGPAGPAPEPRGPRPSSPSPGTQKPPPASPKGALLAMDDALASLEHVASRRLPDPGDRVEACGQAILAFRLKRARAAVADLLAYENSGRDGKAAAAVSRPVQLSAGRPPASGGGFTLPRPPEFEIGVGQMYDALPRTR